MNSILELLDNRVSLRKFSDRKISEEDIQAILNGAMRSPTAGNQMLYSIIKVQDKDIKEKIAEICNHQKFIASAPVVLVFLADQYKWLRYNQLNHVPEYAQNEGIKWHTPSLSDLLLAFEDTLIAAQSAVIAAESLGIGSCYIGSTLIKYKEMVKLLHLPEYVVPLMVLPLGYYPSDFKRVHSERFEAQYVVFDEKYQKLGDPELKEMFEKKSKTYHNPSNNNTAKNYAQAFYKSKTGSTFMNQMAESIEELLSEWNNTAYLHDNRQNNS